MAHRTGFEVVLGGIARCAQPPGNRRWARTRAGAARIVRRHEEHLPGGGLTAWLSEIRIVRCSDGCVEWSTWTGGRDARRSLRAWRDGAPSQIAPPDHLRRAQA